MELKLPASKDLARVWQESFLGTKGFFIPGDHEFILEREMDIDLIIAGEKWGTLKMVPVWANLYGPVSTDLPRGTFLKLLSCESELEKKIRDCCS